MLVTLLALVAIAVGGALAALYNLDAPLVKARVQALVRKEAGIDLDYREAHLRLRSGLTLTDVFVRSPPPVAAISPDLARIEKLDVHWSNRRIDRVALSGVSVDVAFDEKGRSSLDFIGSGPSTPLSQRAGSVVSLPAITVDRATLAVTRRVERTIDRTAVTGLAFALEPTRGSSHLRAGSAAAPLAVGVVRSVDGHAAGEGHARLWLEADATKSDLHAVVEIDALEQSFASEVDVSTDVRAEVTARFDPAAKTTRLDVERVSAGGGIAELSAALDVPDAGAPVIVHASGAVDLARLVALVPPALLPVRMKMTRGRADFALARLALDGMPPRGTDASVDVEAHVAGLVIERAQVSTADATVHLAGGTLDASLDADEAVRDGVEARAVAAHVRGDPKAWRATVAFRELRAAKAAARDGEATIDANEGDLVIDADVATLTAAGRALHDVRAHVHPSADGTRADLDARAAFEGLPLHLLARVSDLDRERVTGRAIVDLAFGSSWAHADLARGEHDLDYTIGAALPRLGPLRAIVPKAVEARGLRLRGHGHLTDRALSAHTEIDVAAPNVPPLASARELRIAVDSRGDLDAQTAHGAIELARCKLGATAPVDDTIAFDLKADRSSIDAEVAMTGHARASAHVALARHPDDALAYDVDARATELGPLVALALPGLAPPAFDANALALDVSGKGTVRGSVIDGTIASALENVHFDDGAFALDVGQARINARLGGTEDHHTVAADLRVTRVKVADRLHAFETAQIDDAITAELAGDVLNPVFRVQQKVSIAAVKQDLAPMYRVGDAILSVSAWRTREGLIHVSDFTLTNPAGGTAIALQGAIDPNEPKRLSLHGTVKQDLSRISSDPKLLAASGRATIALDVQSPNLQVFRTNADIELQNANVDLPTEGVHIEQATGRVPVTTEVRLADRGPLVLRALDDPYAELRFADQLPLLNRSSFLSVKRIALPQDVVIDSLIGNFEVAHDVFALRQFEMGYRGGRVTGQCALEWNREKSILDLRIRADHVRSSHGEPLTGTAALTVTARDHRIEGRADILQIGKRHLLDVLDIEDPFHTDPSINGIRRALDWGYPDHVRLAFQRGFANAQIELGGLARFFHVSELKGLPVGPVIERYFGPIFPEKVATR